MLHSPQFVDSMFKATAGDVCSYGGEIAYGHYENPVDEVEPFNEGGTTLLAQPSFVCANGILPDIGYDEIDGARGVGIVVSIQERGIDGTLGEEFSWQIAKVLRRDDDGGEIRLLLTCED